jgi:ketosteroid isomerase-like protein
MHYLGSRYRGGKMDEQIKQFFEHYEKVRTSADGSVVAALYADTFMFGGPNGIQAVKKDDLAKAVPKMKAHFAAMGLSETRLHSVSVTVLDSRYILAKTSWALSIWNSAGSTRHVDAFATYIMERRGDTFSIVLQIDHQDLATVIRDNSVEAPVAQHD